MPTAILSCALSDPAVDAHVTITYHGSGGAPRIELTGAQTYVVDLAMMPTAGLRGLLVTVDRVDAAGIAVATPVTIRRVVNSITINEPLGPGGILMLADPTVAAGTTALSIISTASAVVHVTALG